MLFENFGKKISKVSENAIKITKDVADSAVQKTKNVAESAVQKTKSAADAAKLNVLINDEEKNCARFTRNSAKPIAVFIKTIPTANC